tara:strand:- start:3786 stop:4370 length:585 start_codon:yes stop_codon:yes gene_type:complete
MYEFYFDFYNKSSDSNDMNTSPYSSEVFDVVDENDLVIGQAMRSEVHQQALLHRAVHIFARSEYDQWIIQKRSSQKDLDPLLLTSSCSGHVDAGEEYRCAAVRECSEELGVSLKRMDLLEILRVSPCLETGNEFVRVYLTKHVISPVPNKEEIFCLEAMNLEQINEKIKKEGELFSKSFLHLFPLVVHILERLH